MNLIRYYNQNRKKIKGILIIIASAFILLQLVNGFYKMNNEKQLKTNNNNEIVQINTNATTLTTNQSVVTGESVSNTQLKTSTEVIDKFISYCNEKNLEKAYELLTDECKEQLYNTVEVFEQAYYNNIFHGERKTCSIENWVNNTYKVRIFEDMLSTGQINNGYAKQDYITVKKVDNEYKLNINNYIGFTEINKTTENQDISINVVSKNTHMDYEEFTIKVTNNKENDIILDGKSDVDSLFLEDKNGKRYSSYIHELTDPMLGVPSKQTRELTIKFYSSYVSTKDIKYIVFSNLISYDGEISEKIELKVNV